jgi:hypothetical protein
MVQGGSMVAHQTDVLQSQIRIWHLPNPQLTANLLVGSHHENEKKHIKKKKVFTFKEGIYLSCIDWNRHTCF